MAEKKRRGRPRGGEYGGGLTRPLTVRMPEALKDQLIAAARRSGRSMAQELFFRLDKSFSNETWLRDK
jgi:hypothetical protein